MFFSLGYEKTAREEASEAAHFFSPFPRFSPPHPIHRDSLERCLYLRSFAHFFTGTSLLCWILTTRINVAQNSAVASLIKGDKRKRLAMAKASLRYKRNKWS